MALYLNILKYGCNRYSSEQEVVFDYTFLFQDL
jgi:hypothetical protein